MTVENTGSKKLFDIEKKTESGRNQHTTTVGNITAGYSLDRNGKRHYASCTHSGPYPRSASAVYTFTWRLAAYYGDIDNAIPPYGVIYSKTIDLSKEFPHGLTGDLIFSINSDTGEVTWRTEKGYYGSEEFRQRRFVP